MPILHNRTEFDFAAAHRLPFHGEPCDRVHGHNFKLVVIVAGEPDAKSGMVIDFMVMREVVERRVISRVDHKYLNEIVENPTAENLCCWVWDELLPELPGLSQIELYENKLMGCIYRGERHVAGYGRGTVDPREVGRTAK